MEYDKIALVCVCCNAAPIVHAASSRNDAIQRQHAPYSMVEQGKSGGEHGGTGWKQNKGALGTHLGMINVTTPHITEKRENQQCSGVLP